MVAPKVMVKIHSPRYLPRKGTETEPDYVHQLLLDFLIRHDIYPARGRKHGSYSDDIYHLLDSPRYLPRKGTETTGRIASNGLWDTVRHDIYPSRDGNNRNSIFSLE